MVEWSSVLDEGSCKVSVSKDCVHLGGFICVFVVFVCVFVCVCGWWMRSRAVCGHCGVYLLGLIRGLGLIPGAYEPGSLTNH